MSFLKVPIYRNRKLLDLARVAPKCFGCNRDNDGTVVAAHSNSQAMGKGMGIKAADLPAYLCHTCHANIDSPSNRGEAEAMWFKAHALSMRWAHEHHPEVFR